MNTFEQRSDVSDSSSSRVQRLSTRKLIKNILNGGSRRQEALTVPASGIQQCESPCPNGDGDDGRGRSRVSSPRQDKNRRRSRSRSMVRRASIVGSTILAAVVGDVPAARGTSRSISRRRPVAIGESILLYEKSRVNASIQLRLNRLLLGQYLGAPAWYLRIAVSVARGRLDIKDAIFRLKFRCPSCSNTLWTIKKYSPLKLMGKGPDVGYVGTRSIEVGAQLGRDELKGETKVSHGRERSYVQENCYALELAEINNILQAHLWRVGDANTVTPPSRFTLQVVVGAPCDCDRMDVTADLNMNSGSEKAYGSWRPVPLIHGELAFRDFDFGEWDEEDWEINDNSVLFDARYVLICPLCFVIRSEADTY